MVVSNLHVNLVPDLKQGTFVSISTQPSDNLEQLAVGRPQRDQGHLAGVRVDLLDQQGQLGRPVFPILNLNLDKEMVGHTSLCTIT